MGHDSGHTRSVWCEDDGEERSESIANHKPTVTEGVLHILVALSASSTVLIFKSIPVRFGREKLSTHTEIYALELGGPAIGSLAKLD